MTLPDLSMLSPGQRRAVEALIGGSEARTYRQAAAIDGIGVGTLFRHLHRVRQRHPVIYQTIMKIRSCQLADRHRVAILNARAHSRAWFRRKANRRYRERFGHWPWER